MSVVTGGSRTGKSHLIAQLRSSRPPGERWAWLSNGGTGDSAAGPPPVPGADAADEHYRVVGGCACCLAGPAFRTTLVRLLRAGPWQRLHIEVDATGHAPALVDQLRGPPFDQYLEVTQLLLTLAGSEPPPGRGADDDLHSPAARIGLATDFLLRTPPVAGVAPGSVASSAAALEAAPPWPRLERGAGRALAGAESGLLPSLPGWRIFSALPFAEAPAPILQQWPAATVALRRPFKELLTDIAAEPGVVGLQALMRTARSWYRWRFGRGQAGGALAFDEGPQLVEAETAWRFDNRLCVWLGPGARRVAVLARVAALDRALQGCEDPPKPPAG